MRYVIIGEPIPLLRARHGNRRTWDSQKQQKLIYGINLKSQHDEQPLFQGPIHLDIIFFMEPPQSRRRHTLEHQLHIFRPDLSNLIKFVEDVASGILYADDCIIASISARKCYSESARTEFEIKELKK